MTNAQTEPQKDHGKAQSGGQSGKNDGDMAQTIDRSGAEVNNDKRGTTATTISEEEYKKLKDELEKAQKKLEEMTGITQHALADLKNFHRRNEEDRKNWVLYANTELLLELLPAIENMNRALVHEPKDDQWIKGTEQTIQQFLQILERKNLKIIETRKQKFDPKLHEALLTAPGEKDLILEELEKGYMLGDKVLKAARVKVGNGEKEIEKKS